jgi:hypothetical protein
VAGQHPAEARLRALRELELDRPDRALGDALAQAVEIEVPVLAAAAEVARPDLEDELAAVQVRRREPALADVVQARRDGRAPVERLDAGGESDP